MATYGAAIKSMRKARGLTLRELAESAGTSAGYLSRVERGERIPTDRWMESIIRAFGNELRRTA